MYDNNGSGYCRIENPDLSSSSSGTIEFWHLTSTSDDKLTTFFLLDDGGTEFLRIDSRAGSYRTFDGNNYVSKVSGLSADTWYHHSISFDCTSDTWDWKIDDGITFSESDIDSSWFHDVDTISRVRIQSKSSDSGYYSYFDAIGYSWNPNYSVGDNASAYSQVVYRQAKARRGSHESHRDFSAFDITKMIFPEGR